VAGGVLALWRFLPGLLVISIIIAGVVVLLIFAKPLLDAALSLIARL
jgi:hypothetical protein